MLEIRAFARKSLDRIFVLRRFEIENERCEMIDKARLEQKCSMWNIALTGEQLDQLDAFAQILVDYNQKVNLTAITDPEGIEDKHFLDSLLFASQPEVAGKMVDVGAGAGFPAEAADPPRQATVSGAHALGLPAVAGFGGNCRHFLRTAALPVG